MIQVTHDSILKNQSLTSFAELSEKELALLGEFEKVQFAFLDYANTEFDALLEEVLASLQESYKIYLIYVESKAQPVNKIRTLKKMFYRHRNAPVFREGDVNEKEVVVANQQSILVSSIRLTTSNRQYVLKNLLNTNFRFGYLVRKGKKSFPKNIDTFLGKVVSFLSDKSPISRINFVELLLSEVKKNKHIFRTPFGLNEKDYLEFLIRKEDKDVSDKLSKVEDKYKELIEN